MGWPLCVCFTNKATPCLGPGLELRGQLVLDQGKKQQQPVVLMAKEDRESECRPMRKRVIVIT